ncbi:MAG: hypothetical protein EBS50_11505 [Sphingomonadaceae bacterium]|nr:hypothetical protein [Sphingomonadaceae bacterium]
MTDKFLSGWGLAKGGNSVLCVLCPDYETAERIERAALRRREMKRVAIADKPRKGAHVTIRHASELTGAWLNL